MYVTRSLQTLFFILFFFKIILVNLSYVCHIRPKQKIIYPNALKASLKSLKRRRKVDTTIFDIYCKEFSCGTGNFPYHHVLKKKKFDTLFDKSKGLKFVKSKGTLFDTNQRNQ